MFKVTCNWSVVLQFSVHVRSQALTQWLPTMAQKDQQCSLLFGKVLMLLCAHTYAFSQCSLVVLPILIIVFVVCFSFLNELISCAKVQIPELTSSFIFRGIWLYISKDRERTFTFIDNS